MKMNGASLQEIEANNFNALLAAVNQFEQAGCATEHTVKVRFLRNYTIEPIAPFLKFHFYKEAIKPIISYSDYGSIEQELLDPGSYLATDKPELVVLSLFQHVYDLFSEGNSFAEISTQLMHLFQLLLDKTQALLLVNTFIPPFYSNLSLISPDISGVPHYYTKLNHWIREFVMEYPSRFIVTDWERYVRILGEANTFDHRYWYMNKAPFKKGFLNLYAQDIGRAVKVLKGKIKKCLILDCDNTLWGGIIGEDGLQGIKLDSYEYPGKIFYDFQQVILSLYKQGILIALCSKNNANEVWQVLAEHPSCLLKREHIAAYRINWEDKASNIASLAQELNLGLDSFVFVDDSDIECELIKKYLPQVSVFTVPKELFNLPQLLAKEHLFDRFNVGEEDKQRTLNYQQEQTRKELAKQFVNIEEYLASLELSLDLCDSHDKEFTRLAQLTQKTNQFNLSLQRYTEAELRYLSSLDHTKIFSLKAKDRFGEYGLTGALIARRYEDFIELDSLLLSCRILSRRLEFAFMLHCLQNLAKEWQLNCFRANFRLTERNGQVKEFLEALGFSKITEQASVHVYELLGMPKTPNIAFIQVHWENKL